MKPPILISNILRDKVNEYCRQLEEITGFDPKKNDRHRPYVSTRAMIAYRLKEEGYSSTLIANLFEKEHSTIIWYWRKMEIVLTTKGYEVERELYKEFLNYKPRSDEGIDTNN